VLTKTRSLTLGALIGAPTVRRVAANGTVLRVEDLKGSCDKKSSVSYGLRIVGAGGARFLQYVVEDGERPLRGLLPGEVRRAL